MDELWHITEVFHALGTPDYRKILTAVDELFMYRAAWGCGCQVDFVDASLGAFCGYWCGAHLQNDIA